MGIWREFLGMLLSKALRRGVGALASDSNQVRGMWLRWNSLFRKTISRNHPPRGGILGERLRRDQRHTPFIEGEGGLGGGLVLRRRRLRGRDGQVDGEEELLPRRVQVDGQRQELLPGVNRRTRLARWRPDPFEDGQRDVRHDVRRQMQRAGGPRGALQFQAFHLQTRWWKIMLIFFYNRSRIIPLAEWLLFLFCLFFFCIFKKIVFIPLPLYQHTLKRLGRGGGSTR